jgi:glutamate N-acetyltransferase/amino-acid N-acetyltransferase
MIKIKGGIAAPKDFKAAAMNCGIKRRKKDVALIASSVPAVAWGMFTQNRVKAAPILVCKEHLLKTIAQAVIVNSGNANCCTGKEGLKNAYLMTELTAESLGINKEDVLVASTGIIGRQLPMKKIKEAIPHLADNLSEDGGHGVAEAIMTTDRVTKEIAFKVKIKGKDVTIGGVAKGAGMVHPNMATMLSFITTDAYITRRALRLALINAIERSFNAISVDGDMSTNDAVIALANGSAGNSLLDKRDKDFETFSEALNEITEYLAKALIKDGEGATKFVQINIKNAKTLEGAKRIARKLATSMLFKTALFGQDPNWGRIAASVGGSGVVFNASKLDIYLGKMKVLKSGASSVKDRVALRRFFKNRDLDVTVDLNSGNKSYNMWTCDLSSDYIRINAHYST